MKKILTYIGLILIFLVLDNSIMPLIAYKGYYGSLLFVFALTFSIIYGEWTGLWLGVLCGLLQDIYFSQGMGINMLTNMLLCVAIGRFGKIIFKEKFLIPILASFFASIIKGILVFTLLYILGVKSNFEVIPYYGAYNLLISIFLYPILYKLTEKNYMQRQWKF